MSGKILPLSESVRSQLRSGITITNVAQCVEELVLNSIDAQATCVAVRVDPSIFRIQVVDNGIGINYDDLKVLGSRHATSKCHSLDDLSHNLAHYGFRGEALASTVDVAAIVDINTRPRGSSESYSKMFTYGKEKSITVLETSRPSAGTTITIRDFMYNMPVRRKLMKEAIDIENIRIRLQSFALMHPKISFSFRNDNTDVKVLQTTKSNCVMSAFMQLFGCDRAQGLVEVKHSIEPFEISGYISTQPHMTKALQFVYVNKRVILKTKIHKMLNGLLSRSSIISSRLHPTTPVPGKTPSSPPKGLRLYSIFIINIECPLSEYDICLDPRKTLVEFKDWNKLLLCIEEMIVNFIHEENLVISLDERFRRSGKDHVTEDDDSPSQPHSSQSLLEVFSLKRHRNDDNSGQSGEKYGQTICTQDNLSAVHSLPAKRVKKKEEELAVQEENNCKVVEKEAVVTDNDILNDDHNANTKIRDKNNEEEDEEEGSSSQCVFRKPLSPVTKRGKRLPLCNGEEARSEDSYADKSEERKARILSSLENFRRVVEDSESSNDGVSCSQSIVSKIQENRYSDDATTLESNQEIALGNSDIRKGRSSSGSDTENKKLSSLEEFLNFYHDDMSKAEQASYKTPHQDILKTPASPPPLRATRSAVKSVSLTQESVCSDISSSHSQSETVKKSPVKKSPVKKYSLSKVLSENRRKHENKTKSLHALLKYEFQKNKQKSSFEDDTTQSKNKSVGVSGSKMLNKDQESFSGSVVLNNRDSSTGVSEGQNTTTAGTHRSEITSCNNNASVTGEESQESEKIDLESSFNFQPVIASLLGDNNCRVEPETNVNIASTVPALPAEDLCLPSVIGNHFMADHQGERQTACQYEGLDVETNSGGRTGMQNWERLQGNVIGPERSIVTSTLSYQPREGEYQSGPDVYNQPGRHQSSGDGALVKEFPSEGNNQACSSDPEGYLEDIPLIDCIANSFDPPISMDADAFSTQPFCVESPVLQAKSTSNSPSKEGFQNTWNDKDFIMQSSQGFIPAHVVNNVDKNREEFGVEGTQSFSPCNTHTGDMQTILGNEDGRKQQQQEVPLCPTIKQKEVEGDSSLNNIPPVHDEMRLSEDMQFRKVNNMNHQYIYATGSSYSSSSPKQCSQGELLPLCNVMNVNEEQNGQIRSQSIYCDETPSQDLSKSQEVQKTEIVRNDGYVAGKPVQSDNADPFPANPLSASLHFSQLTLPAETEQQSTIHRSDGSDTNNDTMLIPPSLPTMSSLSSLSSSSLSRERSQNFKEKMNSLQITFHGKMIQVNGGNGALDCQNNNRDVENDKQTSGSLSSSPLPCQVDKERTAGNSIESLAEDQRTEMVGSASAIGDGSSQLGSENDEISNDVIMQDTVNDDVDENAPANLWKEVSDGNGRIMYVNLRTGNTSYKKPEFREEPEWTSSQPLGAPPLKIPVSYEPGYEPPGKDQTDRKDFVLSHGFSSFLPWKRKEKGKAIDGEKEPCKNHNLQTTNLRPESENSDNISPGTQEAIQALLKDAEMEDESVKWLSKPDLKAEVDPQLSKAVQICRTWEAPTFAMDADILSSEVPKSSDRGTITNKEGPVKIYSTVHPYKFSKEMLRSCKVLGQLDNKFIACDLTYVSEDTPQSKESTLIVIFDQHAVHERIRLEKITEENFETLESGESVIRSSAVTPPLVMSLPEDEVRLMLAYDKVFMQRGLHFSEVSSSKVVFHAIPNCLVAQELNELKHKRCRTASVIVESIVRDMCYTLHQTGGVVGVIPKPLVHVLNSQACRGAVKFGDELSLAECQEMITSLSSCQLPFQCAHGRPSIVPIVNITQVAAQQKKDRKPNLKKLKEMMHEHV